MHFYSLRVVCPECGAVTLLGGSAECDLTRWRHSTVECRRCGVEASAMDARAVDLLTVPRDEAGANHVEAPRPH
jgi:hypothetical protein